MYYVKLTPTEDGNHGNPISNFRDGLVELQDKLISDYCNSYGFVDLTVEEEVVTAVTRNEEAYQAYIDSLPEPEPPEPTEEDDVNSMLVDHEFRLTMLELGVE